MTEHAWVELQYMPVTISIDEASGDVAILSEENADAIAKEGAVHFCWFCNTPLDTETAKTECAGADAPQVVEKS